MFMCFYSYVSSVQFNFHQLNVLSGAIDYVGFYSKFGPGLNTMQSSALHFFKYNISIFLFIFMTPF